MQRQPFPGLSEVCVSDSKAGEKPTRPGPGPRLSHALIVAVVVAAAYGAAGWDHGLLYDDERLVLDEPRPQSLGDLAAAFVEPHYGELPYYRPAVRVTYLAQKALHGDVARPYHLLNATLAGIILLVLFALLRLPVLEVAGWPALLTATWIVLHPATSSCVYAVAGRDTLLPSLFALLAVLAWLQGGYRYRIAAICCLAVAIFGKEQAVVLPVLFVLADVAGLSPRPGSPSRWIGRYAPVAAVVLIYFIVRGVVLTGASPEIAIVHDPLAPLFAFGYGIQTTVAPFANLFYEPSRSVWPEAPRLALAIAVLIVIAWTAKRRRPDSVGILWFWLGWFVITQLPTAGFLEQETSYDERYLFLALVAVGGVAATLLSALSADAGTRRAAAVVSVLVIAIYGGVSMHRARFFADSLTFNSRWVASDPGSAAGHNGMGVALASRGRTDEAIVHYREALRLRPEFAQALGNLGQARWEAGRADEAEALFRRALHLDPGRAEVHFNLGNILASSGRVADAEAHYLTALERRRGYAAAHNNYGALLVAQGRLVEARDQFEAALRARPDHARTLVNLGIVAGRQGSLEEAAVHYRRALDLDPAYPEAHFNLGAASWELGRRDDAIAHLRSALEERPDWVEARRLLAEIESAAVPDRTE
jgi:tetratricopeptide (TPR) repeat protein